MAGIFHSHPSITDFTEIEVVRSEAPAAQSLSPVAFCLFNTAHGPGHIAMWACWIDQQAAKLTPSK
eukprot:COSAG01_NODE_1397_length_10467_cov_9.010706_1_plen_66_part_00